ncbi:hypothetical protein GJA_320 [Janthinobacterium agaricidamnosum NBRC 102515 = DSM 9628]|uniref:Uncharacterized protein n=1 Tax=Janthinobacterium agaricidamnosum NBRC 102515 = DSM 9628 TaxID=1349767 RepID=W0UZE2_9BURK|nr:hypothetical protein GJA_320 [Janthinobacterium agaricidamnosum NBRC 102515 = DSM 9628]
MRKRRHFQKLSDYRAFIRIAKQMFYAGKQRRMQRQVSEQDGIW